MKYELHFASQHKYLGDLEEIGLPIAHPVDLFYRDHTVGGLSHLAWGIFGAHARQQGWNAAFYNANDLFIHRKQQDEYVHRVESNPQAIAMLSSMDINSADIHALAMRLPPERTIVGGVGPTYAPELFPGPYSKATGYVDGQVFSDILRDFRDHHQLAPNYLTNNPKFSSRIADYPELDPTVSPLLDPKWRTSLFAPLETSRACPYQCDFCHTGLHREKATVKPLNIVDEQLRLYRECGHLRLPFIIDYDQNLMMPYHMPQYGREYLLDLMKLFKKHNLYWAGEGTLGDIVENDDRELLKALGERCFSILAGVENLFGDVEGSDGKSTLNGNFIEYMKVLTECRVPVMWSVIGGLDTQTAGYFAKVVEAVKKLGLPMIFHRAVARPGTPFYDKVQDEGRIISDDPRDRDMKFHAAHWPLQMSPAEALGGHAYVHAEVYNLGNIAGRFVRHIKEADLPYAIKCLIPEVHGAIIAPRIARTYAKELGDYREKYAKV